MEKSKERQTSQAEGGRFDRETEDDLEKQRRLKKERRELKGNATWKAYGYPSSALYIQTKRVVTSSNSTLPNTWGFL